MTTSSVDNRTNELTDNAEQNLVLNNIELQDEYKDKVVNNVEIQETFNEDDFIEGLDVVDTWDDEEKDKPRRRSWDRSRGRDKRNSRDREKERDRENYLSRRRSRSVDRKKDLARRDPNKSNKDIEQDKMRTKKDNDNKILAEKEKAIKTLLDSDNVVPPGTEGEAIQNIVDRNQKQEEEENSSKIKINSRDNRRRSPIRSRLGHRRFSPRRSPVRRSAARSPDRRRSPIAFSPDRRRRRSPHQSSPDERRRRGGSFERENSTERREASRRRLREREGKYGRRSRSRDRRSTDRHRSRSLDRHRRSSRSPFDRHSPRRLHNSRRRSLSRSPLRSPNRSRRRSPFINELARQFQTDSMRVDNIMPPMQQPLGVMHGIGPGGPPFMPPGVGPPGMNPRMMPGGPGLVATPQGMLPGPPGITPGPPGIPSGTMDIHPGPVMHPGAIMHPGPPGMPGPPGTGSPFINYDGCQPVPPGINFDLSRGPPPPDYSSAPIMYNQGNPIPPINSISHPMQSSSPQPVPAPGQGPPGGVMYNVPMGPSGQHQQSNIPGSKYSPNPYANHNSMSPKEDMFRSRTIHEERMKTPEPPIISDFKQNEKTSLSSLLEASVSTKDSSSLTVFYRGFRPEIIRHCERALRSLPIEDPRLKMKGRFFFDPSKKDKTETTSNSILLRKGRTEIHWDEEENQLSVSTQQHQHLPDRKRLVTHQKICQTDELTRESISIQVEPVMTDFAMQVCLQDLNQSIQPKEDRRSLTDRLDWSMRETYDHSSKLRDSEDLRWSLTNNSSRERQINPWSRGFSPTRQSIPVSGGAQISVMDIRYNVDQLRDRSGIDRMIDIRDRSMDSRTRGLDLQERDLDLRNMRAMEMMREREREFERERMLDARDVRGNMLDGGRGLEEYGERRELIEDYDMRKSFTSSYSRGMETIEHERKDMQTRGGSPVMLDDDSEELEIIEERILEREPWQSRASGNSIAQFNNTRSAIVSSSNRSNASINRPFRDRITGYRMNF